jgi:hypothetical protein
VTSNPRHEPLFDIHPRTGASIEVFYSDRRLEKFGRCGAGWFYWSGRRGFTPIGSPTGPFATSYAAYRHAMNAPAVTTCECPTIGYAGRGGQGDYAAMLIARQ